MSESIASDVKKNFWSLIRMLRFYVVLRRFGYVDPLIYSIDVNHIKDILTEALRDFVSYASSASEKKIIFKENNESKENKEADAPCFVVAKPTDIPKNFPDIYSDTIYKIKGSDELCISPIYIKDGKVNLAYPYDETVKDFFDKLDSNIQYARVLASLAVSG